MDVENQYIDENVKKGDIIQEQFLEVRGPYLGIKPYYLQDLIGPRPMLIWKVANVFHGRKFHLTESHS